MYIDNLNVIYDYFICIIYIRYIYYLYKNININDNFHYYH